MAADVEVICIGNELLIGKIENTNARWLAQQITRLGAVVKRITVIPDSIEAIATTILEAKARKPSLIITTGGLGPTFDDKTFQGIAKALNQKLVVNQIAYEMVKKKCTAYAKKYAISSDFEMTPECTKMATMPANATPVNNIIGAAPALHVDLCGTLLFALPGVPKEMASIFDNAISIVIKQIVGPYSFLEKSLFLEDIFESRLAPLIVKVMNDNPGVYIKSHPICSPNSDSLELHFTMSGGTPNSVETLENTVKELTFLIKEKGGKIITSGL